MVSRQIIEDNRDIFLVREDSTTWYVELQTRPKMSLLFPLEVASANSKCQASSGQTLLAESEGAGQQRAVCEPEHPSKKMRFFSGGSESAIATAFRQLNSEIIISATATPLSQPTRGRVTSEIGSSSEDATFEPVARGASSVAGSEPKRPLPLRPRYD